MADFNKYLFIEIGKTMPALLGCLDYDNYCNNKEIASNIVWLKTAKLMCKKVCPTNSKSLRLICKFIVKNGKELLQLIPKKWESKKFVFNVHKEVLHSIFTHLFMIIEQGGNFKTVIPALAVILDLMTHMKLAMKIKNISANFDGNCQLLFDICIRCETITNPDYEDIQYWIPLIIETIKNCSDTSIPETFLRHVVLCKLCLLKVKDHDISSQLVSCLTIPQDFCLWAKTNKMDWVPTNPSVVDLLKIADCSNLISVLNNLAKDNASCLITNNTNKIVEFPEREILKGKSTIFRKAGTIAEQKNVVGKINNGTEKPSTACLTNTESKKRKRNSKQNQSSNTITVTNKQVNDLKNNLVLANTERSDEWIKNSLKSANVQVKDSNRKSDLNEISNELSRNTTAALSKSPKTAGNVIISNVLTPKVGNSVHEKENKERQYSAKKASSSADCEKDELSNGDIAPEIEVTNFAKSTFEDKSQLIECTIAALASKEPNLSRSGGSTQSLNNENLEKSLSGIEEEGALSSDCSVLTISPINWDESVEVVCTNKSLNNENLEKSLSIIEEEGTQSSDSSVLSVSPMDCDEPVEVLYTSKVTPKSTNLSITSDTESKLAMDTSSLLVDGSQHDGSLTIITSPCSSSKGRKRRSAKLNSSSIFSSTELETSVSPTMTSPCSSSKGRITKLNSSSIFSATELETSVSQTLQLGTQPTIVLSDVTDNILKSPTLPRSKNVLPTDNMLKSPRLLRSSENVLPTDSIQKSPRLLRSSENVLPTDIIQKSPRLLRSSEKLLSVEVTNVDNQKQCENETEIIARENISNDGESSDKTISESVATAAVTPFLNTEVLESDEALILDVSNENIQKNSPVTCNLECDKVSKSNSFLADDIVNNSPTSSVQSKHSQISANNNIDATSDKGVESATSETELSRHEPSTVLHSPTSPQLIKGKSDGMDTPRRSARRRSCGNESPAVGTPQRKSRRISMMSTVKEETDELNPAARQTRSRVKRNLNEI